MSPTLRYIAFTIALLGLVFWGYRQQLHLPKPSLNPFDDQWEMRTNWLRENCDSITKGMCYDLYYEISLGAYKVEYQTYYTRKNLIFGKSLLVPIDTIKATRSKLYESVWTIAPNQNDSSYFASLNYKLLDSVCSIFGYSPIEFYWLNQKKFGPRYKHIKNQDTIDFHLITRNLSNDSVWIREFRSYHGREPNTFTLID